MNERRILWLLITLLVAQLLLLASQTPSAGGEQTRLQAGALWAVSPIARLVSATVGAASSLGDNLRLRSQLEADVQRLEAENRRLRLRLLRLQDLENRIGPLAKAVDYVPPEGFELQAADILYVDHRSWVRTLILYAPGADLVKDQAVVAPEGLVGRVILVTGPYAKVQLLTDRAASVGAMVQRTRRQGLVQGTARGGLQLAFLPRGSDVEVGDRVVTSGIDGIFPRGLAIGTVASVKAGGDLFQRIGLSSAVDFGTLDHAYLLRRPALPEEVRESLPGEP